MNICNISLPFCRRGREQRLRRSRKEEAQLALGQTSGPRPPPEQPRPYNSSPRAPVAARHHPTAQNVGEEPNVQEEIQNQPPADLDIGDTNRNTQHGSDPTHSRCHVTQSSQTTDLDKIRNKFIRLIRRSSLLCHFILMSMCVSGFWTPADLRVLNLFS